ncbi:thiamine biosynthesis protein ThiJ [Priestia megaterium]|uniref:Thiamine biosynthesis protein ThiJ n=1 Tax=Priestia megaterium TaxID=1404 RepID=A0A3D8WTV8_PRIMG|nr:DJ-1/PfpI family protein [Priestia megaterium]MDH3168871.1 DJ-1/PfpI family protein [Priestia megaterium]RDZ06416.1 thiamine biosynthesis protein ThiJ [Priestia megaterium]
MKVGFILFDQLTALDFIGFYDGITRLKTLGFKKDLTWDLCALSNEISDDRGITFKINKVSPDLSEYDLIFVPGGMGTRALQYDTEFINWLKTAKAVPYKVSVCTGSLLLGAAGFLTNIKATTHPNGFDLLKQYTDKVEKERIVKDSNIITGGGVATSVDLGLYICELIDGPETAARIQKQMDYPYYKTGIVN